MESEVENGNIKHNGELCGSRRENRVRLPSKWHERNAMSNKSSRIEESEMEFANAKTFDAAVGKVFRKCVRAPYKAR